MFFRLTAAINLQAHREYFHPITMLKVHFNEMQALPVAYELILRKLEEASFSFMSSIIWFDHRFD